MNVSAFQTRVQAAESGRSKDAELQALARDFASFDLEDQGIALKWLKEAGFAATYQALSPAARQMDTARFQSNVEVAARSGGGIDAGEIKALVTDFKRLSHSDQDVSLAWVKANKFDATHAALTAAQVPLVTEPRSGLAKLPSGRSMFFQRWEGQPGKPVYVLAHGLTKNGRFWNEESGIVRRLQEQGYGVVTVDLHGAGSGSRTPEQYGARSIPSTDNSADLAALIEQQDLKDVILVGHSYGGWISLEAAARPELQGRLKAVYAASPYLQNLAGRGVMEYWGDNGYGHFTEKVSFEEGYAMAQQTGKIPEFLDTLERKFGRATRGAVEGLPLDGIANAPHIPKDVLVKVVTGGDNSMLPNEARDLWSQWVKLGSSGVQTNIDRSMPEALDNALQRQGHPQVYAEAIGHGSHMWPQEYPGDFVEEIRKGGYNEKLREWERW